MFPSENCKEVKRLKNKAGLAQAVHYRSERTVTCEEISGMGPEHRADKAREKKKARKIKSEITRGQEKRGLLCMCINRVYDEVRFLCCVQWRGAKESGGEREDEEKSMANYTRSAGLLYSMAAIS